MLIGQYQGNLSDKHRLAIPKKFREELGNKVIVAKWYEECIVVISEKNWIALLDKLTGKQEILVRSVRDTDRFILGSAFEAECDDQGRIVLPQSLIDFSQLKSNIIFLGLGSRVEIWDEEKWSIREKQISERASDAIEELADKQG